MKGYKMADYDDFGTAHASEEKARNDQRIAEQKASRDAFCKNLKEQKWGSDREKQLDRAKERGSRL